MFGYAVRIPLIVACLLFGAIHASAQSNGYRMHALKGNFEDVLTDLRDAIVNKGLVIDYTGHVDRMLARTSAAVGAKSPYKNAKYMQFCSASLTNAAVNANPANMAICPYVIFAYETITGPGTIHIGYRRPIGAASAPSQAALANIDKLLDEIVQSVTK